MKDKVLNVAEKNDAAKNLAAIMSRGTSQRREGLSKYNKIYEFDYDLGNHGPVKMVMTSVSGHLLNLDFNTSHRKWNSCEPVALFEAPITIECPEDYVSIKKTLEREVRTCNTLIIWTDCDREGENIGFEVMDVCKKIKPGIRVFRARFSEITSAAVNRAVRNLTEPDKKTSDAVNVRRELDLRIGAAYTRFLTMFLQNKIRLENQVLSYGSCQFPTLGFVVERFKEIQNFVSNPFWVINVKHSKNGIESKFNWDRVRLFDEDECLTIYIKMLQNPEATVKGVKCADKSNWRPQPMDTVTLEKLGSNKLKINAKTVMTIAEKLYSKGFISYPRTETNIFPPELNLRNYVEMQTESNKWGDFARKVLEWGTNPRNGNKTDKAHPPIHPTKYTDSLRGDDERVYELIVRHFLGKHLVAINF